MVARNTLILGILLLFCAGCKGTGSDSPRILNARFLNKKYTVEKPAKVYATTASSLPVSISYKWFVNGMLVPDINTASLPPDYFNKKDNIVCEIRVTDSLGRESEPYKLGPVTIENSLPEIIWADFSLTDDIYKGIDLSIIVQTKDIDDDVVTIRYTWYLDNKFLSNDSVLDGQLLKAGKNVRVELVPYDGDTVGESFEITRPIIVQNLPPKVIGTLIPVMNDSLIICKIDVEDPDGDQVSYVIEEGPPGMTIDNTGRIQWKRPETLRDTTYNIVVMVTDSRGAGERIKLPLKITKSLIQ
ncbi:unnamed protein product [marine sediment metagenome]|uniref:Cadherin domain-containing protein n=1 Tax=marine sediment metagenome TaxID=412755 RepID=X1QPS8_9ZZZZ